MKTTRQFCVGVVLTLMFAIPTLAGDIHTMATASEPATASVTTQGQMDTGVAGDISTGISDEAAADESLTNVAYSLLQGVLSLF